MQKKYLIIISLIVLLGFGGFYYFSHSSTEAVEVTNTGSETLSRTVFVRQGEIAETFFADGQVEAKNRVDIKPELSNATIKEVLVEPGQQVVAGQKLFLLDDRELALKVAEAQNALEIAKTRLEQSQASLKVQEDEVLKLGKLYKQKAVIRDQLDGAKIKLETQKNDLKLAQREVEKAEYGLQTAQINQEKAIITSPIEGVITSVNVGVGNVVNETVASVIKMNPLDVKVYVDEIDFNKLKLGQQAVIRVDAYQDREFKGNVYYISQEGLNQSGVISFPAYIEVENQDLSLKPGMTAEAELVLAKKDDTLLVPTDAIKTSSGKKYVEVLVDGQKEERTIKTGINSGGYTEVLQGLQKMERVVVTMESRVNPYTGSTNQESSSSRGIGSFMPSIFGGSK